MYLLDLIKEATRILQELESARLEAQIILGFVLSKDMVFLHANPHFEIDEKSKKLFLALVQKRASHYPLEYITGKVSFYSESFFVEQGVLIPRPETEQLVDLASKIIKKHRIQKMVEVGTGSGCVSIMLALLHPDLKIVATDINPQAIELAQKNAHFHGVGERISFITTNMLDGVSGNFELLVSNPPYIKNDYVLPKNVSFEPKEALFGGENGDEFLQKLIKLAKNNGFSFACFEIGYDQEKRLSNFCTQNAIGKCGFYKDLSGFDRNMSVEF